MEIKATALDGREPVEGLDLDVGKPIITSRSIETTAKLKLGAIREVLIFTTLDKRLMLILRINRVGAKSKLPEGATERPSR